MTPEITLVDSLAVSRYGPEAGAPVVLVHGAMDRSAGFRRCARHLPDLRVTTYDRRGYAGSIDAGIASTMAASVADLMLVIDAETSGPISVVGHSLGGLIALHAAFSHPDRIVSVGAWESPMPWVDWYVSDAAANARRVVDVANNSPADPGDAAESFMRTMIGDRLWERLPAAMRTARRAEGATLLADLAMTRSDESRLDFTQITVPVIAGSGSDSQERFRRSAATLMAEVPGAMGIEVAGSTHGVHLTHPLEFAAMISAVVARAPQPLG